MNANRRLEEFILKLSTRQNEAGQFDKINELKLNLNRNDLKVSQNNINNIDCNKPSFIVNNN
jgi:hypothetical protein